MDTWKSANHHLETTGETQIQNLSKLHNPKIKKISYYFQHSKKDNFKKKKKKRFLRQIPLGRKTEK